MRRLQQAIRKMHVQEEIGSSRQKRMNRHHKLPFLYLCTPKGMRTSELKVVKKTVPTIKGERVVRTKYSIFIIVAAVALMAFSFPVPAFSQMKDMSMKGHGEGHGQMMEMGTMEKMGDMMGMCMQHADMMGLTDDQISKMKPMHSEMQKNRPDSKMK